jgi:hypothetical protein
MRPVARINKILAIEIRADSVTRVRSIGKTPKDIAKLDRFLLASLQNVNDLSPATNSS